MVDLWDGVADHATGRAWERDTIGVLWSCTKGATALCAHMLVTRGQLELDRPVAAYWPEVAQNGKDAITMRMLLAHQAGLGAFSEPIPDDGYCDWDLIVNRLAGQAPLWAPGTRHGYHALTYGHLVGELVRRLSGRSLGTFFRDEVAEPLGLDLWIGLPEEHETRVAPTIAAPFPEPGDVIPTFYRVAMTDPTSVGAQAVDGVQLVDGAELAAMGAVTSATAVDATMLVPTRWALGFVKSVDNSALAPGDRDGVVLAEEAFGHVGMGGSIGFADPYARMSFGYTMNRQGMAVGLDERAQSLIDATYTALGYERSPRGGSWYARRT